MTSREQKLEEALQEIVVRCHIERYDDLKLLANNALFPELKPEVGKLYFMDNGDSTFFSSWTELDYENTSVSDYDEIRLPTENEWVELGCPVIEVNKTMPITPEQELAKEAITACENVYEIYGKGDLNAESLINVYNLGKRIAESRGE